MPSIDPQLVKDSLKPLLIEPHFALADSLATAIGIGVLGQALARLLGERASLPWLLLLAVLVLAVKPFIVIVELDLSTVIGFAMGCMTWALLLRFNGQARATVLLAALFLVLTLTSLESFHLADEPNPIGRIPFAEVLEGSMLVNARALIANLFFYTAILWLFRLHGVSLGRASLLLALWVALLEAAQLFVIGRTPSVTEPLWVLLVAFVLSRLTDQAQPWDARRTPARAQAQYHADTARALTETTPWQRLLLPFAVIAALGAAALLILLQLPGIPYNLRELLLGESHPLAAWVFMLAVLWIGAGAAWMAHLINRSRWPILSIPTTAFVAAMVSLLLLMLSVTQESLLDIAGSTNLHWFVTNKDIWGEPARNLFLAVDPDVVAFVERPVRYAALYGPIVIFLALAQAAWMQLQNQDSSVRTVATRLGWLMLNALPWLLLCKTIVFDWSSTDNLNELITREGLFGLHGDYFLYALMALLAVDAVLIANAHSRRAALIAVLVSILSIPLAWWLLDQGLADQVEKYGLTFSGVQFLLGPDRSDLLSEEALLARWVAVQTAAVMTFAFGLRLASPIFTPAARSANRGRTSTNTISPNRRHAPVITVNLTEHQLDFLEQVAEQLGLDLRSALQRILDSVLDEEQAESTLLDQLPRPQPEAGDLGQRLHAIPIALRADQGQRLSGIAEQADVSVSRTIRRALHLFMESTADSS
ncbi:hypothetical protein [Halochromatium glycolicum]|uniref:hypothetical protein n=1 Tax=Halochromatium glycolicum TaxID=85075 RepID=UPI001F5B47C9|nr:hypothetical protein [Halochromatium glycolicum]